MPKRPVTFNYIVFYILFLPDTYQILIGIITAVFLAPQVFKPEMTMPSKVMIYIMVGTIGYAASRIPGKWISEVFKTLILGDKQPGKGA